MRFMGVELVFVESILEPSGPIGELFPVLKESDPIVLGGEETAVRALFGVLSSIQMPRVGNGIICAPKYLYPQKLSMGSCLKAVLLVSGGADLSEFDQFRAFFDRMGVVYEVDFNLNEKTHDLDSLKVRTISVSQAHFEFSKGDGRYLGVRADEMGDFALRRSEEPMEGSGSFGKWRRGHDGVRRYLGCGCSVDGGHDIMCEHPDND